MDTPLVSIITITHNRSKLIHRCIESIQKQTYQNYEHIIVDGISTDDTEKVIKNYNDKHIVYIKSDVNNVPKNHWKGVFASNGKYITSLDDDDEYLPTKIEEQVSLFESLPQEYGVVYCWMNYFDNQTKQFLKVHNPQLKGNVLSENVEYPMLSGTPIVMFRRSDVIKYQLGYKENIGYHSDWEYITRACRLFKVDYIPKPLVNIYVNHSFSRASVKGYYSYEQSILFHNHFLIEFKDVFDKYPKKKKAHLEALVNSYLYNNQFKKGWESYLQLLNIDFTFKSLVRPFYVLSRKLIRK